MEYLTTLRQNDQPPPRSDILYPELVAALNRESAPDIYEDDEILWSGNGYSAPADTILGGRWNKVFLGGVPIVNTPSKTLKRAYRELGARDRPEQRHWEQFFESLGRTYRQEPSSVSASQRSALRKAYLHCDDMSSFPSDVPWLLDDEGHLHTTSDAVSGRFVIEDDVPLGTTLRRLGVSVAFADNANSTVTLFFRRQGVKLLTGIRTKVKDRVGGIRSAPKWFREEEYVRRLTNADFRSALEAVAARDFSTNSDVLDRIRKTGKRLDVLQTIAFVHDIFCDYRFGKREVSVSTQYAWTDNNIHLIWVRSRSGLEGVLASLIARESLPDERGDHARFSDSVFRLIACQTSRDLQEYLEQRGIRWHPQCDSDDHDSADYMSDVEEAVRAAVRSRSTSAGSAGFSSSREAERTGPTEHPDTGLSAPLTLPPIEAVNARIVQPSGEWSYSPGPSGRSWGGGGGWSPGNRNEERDRVVGRRGEEIVYMLERARVREAGYPEDRVVWVSEANPASDFDIESVDDDGNQLYIEVKATIGSDGKFHWSKSEFHRAMQEQNRYILYRVYLVNDLSPVVCGFRNPVALISCGGLHLDIESFRAEVQPNNNSSNSDT